MSQHRIVRVGRAGNPNAPGASSLNPAPVIYWTCEDDRDNRWVGEIEFLGLDGARNRAAVLFEEVLLSLPIRPALAAGSLLRARPVDAFYSSTLDELAAAGARHFGLFRVTSGGDFAQ